MVDLELKLKNIPWKSGAYLFKDESGEVLYVGKAANLNHRVRSYFQGREDLSVKLQRMVSRVQDIDFILAGSEQEALILESNLIKRYRPRYNVRLKDDKSYPYLKLDLKEEYPRFYIIRRPQPDGSRYFGPFASASSLKATMNLIKKLFPIRSCNKIMDGKNTRPCLEYHIHRCLGPCTEEVNREEYMKVIKQVVLFLEGKSKSVLKELKRGMMVASREMQFERAAQLRDQIKAIENIIEQQRLTSISPGEETDVIALARDRDQAFVQLLFIRSGSLVGKDHFILEGVEGEVDGHILSSFIKQFYEIATDLPGKILLSSPIEEEELLSSWLKGKKGTQVKLKRPLRRQEKNLLSMAMENAREGIEQFKMRQIDSPGSLTAALAELAEQLRLPSLPHRIECYDVSNIQGMAATASMVVFEDGLPLKSHYRRFRIREVQGPDDYAMMREVLRRRLKRKLSENGKWALMPDLILVDGGKGQLNASLEVVRELGLDNLSLASIAKEREEIYLPDVAQPVILSPRSPALYLIQRIRDEAHRFALGYHQKLRAKASLSSALDDIPGLGKMKKKALLKNLGSVRAIGEVTSEEMQRVPGITGKLAERIKEALS